MKLCSLCRSLPSISPPEFPANPVAEEELLRQGLSSHFKHWSRKESVESLSLPYHGRLSNLERVAEDCCLCQEVYAAGIARVRRFSTEVPADPELWLVARWDISWNQGFAVICCSRSLEYLLVFAVVGYFAPPSPSEAILPGVDTKSKQPSRALSVCFWEKEQDDSSNKLISHWFKQCANTHDSCPDLEDALLPTRVLDIDPVSRPGHICLLETKGKKGRYTALSYCWGRPYPERLTLTKDTFPLLLGGYLIKQLPKVYRDAIKITRHLGIRYLWIDALCILQDDAEDWATESLLMARVYSNALLTIAAESAREPQEGCYLDRPGKNPILIEKGQLKVLACSLDVSMLARYTIRNHYYSGIGPDALVQRAWTLQERALARRIVHCCDSLLQYECNHHFVNEVGESKRFRPVCAYSGDLQHFEMLTSYPERSKHHYLWKELVANYSQRQLSWPSDRLPALSGLAGYFQKRICAEYVSGLWADNLIDELLWQVNIENQRTTVEHTAFNIYLGPSWSWVSVNRPIEHFCHGFRVPMAKILETDVEISTSNALGSIKNGWLKIRAPLFPLKLVGELSEFEYLLQAFFGAVGAAAGSQASFDRKFQSIEQLRSFISRTSLYAMVLTTANPGVWEWSESVEYVTEDIYWYTESPSEDAIFEALLVSRLDDDSPVYRREGHIKLEYKDMGNWTETLGNYDTITLM